MDGQSECACLAYAESDAAGLVQVTDKSIPFMPRTEVIDVRSGAHLGHVFNGETSLPRMLLTDVMYQVKQPCLSGLRSACAGDSESKGTVSEQSYQQVSLCVSTNGFNKPVVLSAACPSLHHLGLIIV